jgi:hypothetical protein
MNFSFTFFILLLLLLANGFTEAVRMVTLERFSSTDCTTSTKIASQFYAVSGVCRQLGQSSSFRLTCGVSRQVYLNSNKCEGTPNVEVDTNFDGVCVPLIVTSNSFRYTCTDATNVLELQHKNGNCTAAITDYTVYAAAGVCSGYSATFNDIAFSTSWKVEQAGTAFNISTFNSGDCTGSPRSFGSVTVSTSAQCSNGATAGNSGGPDSVTVAPVGSTSASSLAQIGTSAVLVIFGAVFFSM